MFDLTGKVALVTGSTQGIGRAIVEGLIAAGAKVVISNESAAETAAVAAELAGPLIADQGLMARRMALTPLRRADAPQEFAGAAIFLASPAGDFISGPNLVVDGGTLITDGS